MDITYKILKYLRILHDQPFGNKIKGSKDEYNQLYLEAKSINYELSNKIEKRFEFQIDKIYLDNLALHTQVVIKNSKLNYQHGRLLYSILSYYINNILERKNNEVINILETGTARGFSSICMSKALIDNEIPGKILTIDQISHKSKIYWNSNTFKIKIGNFNTFKIRNSLEFKYF